MTSKKIQTTLWVVHSIPKSRDIVTKAANFESRAILNIPVMGVEIEMITIFPIRKRGIR